MRTYAETPLQRIVITIDLNDEPGTDTIGAGAFLDVLSHLEHDGIRPHRSTLEIRTATP